MTRRAGLWIAISLLALTGCSTPSGLLDPCDGTDDDGDGIVDEGVGAEIGCASRGVCVDGLCTGVCGDFFCDTDSGENCSACAMDCGACPRCGDGTCLGLESCSSCPADCGACPSCGDGTCNGSETCTTCRDDCGLCPGECSACGDGFTCASGLECGSRLCDGAEACYGTGAGATCPEVDGDPCGSVSAYARCTSTTQCGPRMQCWDGHCTPIGSGGAGIPSLCEDPGAGVFCPPAPSSPAGLSIGCIVEDVGPTRCCRYRCLLRCTGSCPYGMTCVEGTCS
jgi:hypothetical protein